MRKYLFFEIDLQLFAEKTEPATPKRRREMREKGQVPKSKELVTAIMLLITFFSMKLLSSFVFNNLITALRTFLDFSPDLESKFTNENIIRVYLKCLFITAKITLPILLIIAITIIIVNYLQIGFIFTAKPLMPSISKLNPIEGFKRMFSKNAFVELLKSVMKIGIIGYVVYDYLRDNYIMLPELLNMNTERTAVFIGSTIINIGIKAAAVLLVLSLFDYGFQVWDYEKRIKMSKQEVKDEYKIIEGDPLIKSKIREKQRQLAIRRMMAEVPHADVIITNPTHFAVAVKYDSEASDAPVVTAKGKDLIAERIKHTAKENKVPIVENKLLAQALYKSVEIGEKIPAELYKAVAEVLAFVYSLKEK